MAFISSTHTNTVSAVGREELVAVAVEYAFDLVVDELDRQLHEGLALVGHAGGRAPHHPPEEPEAEDTQHGGW